MSAHWVIGDVHGCAEELALLLEKLELDSEDKVLFLGDLYQRGPDPFGVSQLILNLDHFDLVLGNHERIMLDRVADWGAPVEDMTAEDLAGDGGTPLDPFPHGQAGELIKPLRVGDYVHHGECLGPEGQKWLAVHAGVLPGKTADEWDPWTLTRTRHVADLPGEPFWAELWKGPELIVFGHTSFPKPYPRFQGETMVSLGLDTGCVYGGALTAWEAQSGRIVSVPALRCYWPRS